MIFRLLHLHFRLTRIVKFILYFRPDGLVLLNYIYANKNNAMNRIQAVLEEKGVSKAELARLLHKSKGTITLYTSNQVQPPIPVLFEIARLLKTDPRELLQVKNR